MVYSQIWKKQKQRNTISVLIEIFNQLRLHKTFTNMVGIKVD